MKSAITFRVSKIKMFFERKKIYDEEHFPFPSYPPTTWQALYITHARSLMQLTTSTAVWALRSLAVVFAFPFGNYESSELRTSAYIP